MKLNKNMILKTCVILMTVVTIFATANVQAREAEYTSTDEETKASSSLLGSTIISEGKSFTDVSDAPISISDVISNFLPVGQVLIAFATGILLVVGMILGIKYMIAGANEKANLKEKLIWYVFSIVLIYGAVGIATLVFNVVGAIISG